MTTPDPASVNSYTTGSMAPNADETMKEYLAQTDEHCFDKEYSFDDHEKELEYYAEDGSEGARLLKETYETSGSIEEVRERIKEPMERGMIFARRKLGDVGDLVTHVERVGEA